MVGHVLVEFPLGYHFGALVGTDSRDVALPLGVLVGQEVVDQILPDRLLQTGVGLQLAERLAITPNLQFISNPALNPDADSIWLFGLRMRLAL